MKKRAAVYIDGQNLFNSVKRCFGYNYPNYDILALAKTLCNLGDWELVELRFYTGIPHPDRDFKKHCFWANKLRAIGRQKLPNGQHIIVYSRPLQYVNGVPAEKGIDVRIAIDMIRGGLNGIYDVAVLLSQDQDFSEVVRELKEIAAERGHSIKAVSSYPSRMQQGNNQRGISNAEPLPFDKNVYDQCIDGKDYRPTT